ncbi:MAG: molybdenum cofactor guanylyltransferase [Planctomycetes bacterium]|nr:molybdenum cofactor guanylyltransferase [Planctomycetota bacterium]
MTNNKITAVILCGGQSKRIGRNKAFLKIDNKPFIEIIINKLQGLFQKIIISAKQPAPYRYLKSAKVVIVNDRSKILGSLVGIYSALKKSPTEYIFVIAVDMPNIETKLIKRLLRNYKGYDVVIPETRKGLEPLCAVYSKKCSPFIQEQIRQGNYKIIDFFDKAKVKTIRLNRDGLFNVNTLKDYYLLR